MIDLNDLYPTVLLELLEEGEIAYIDSILVVNGGDLDFEVLRKLGFINVVISNLDERIDESSPFEPFGWSRQNTAAMTFEDESFDYVIVHAGLHHLRCPQGGILEMYRVARKGILGFEPHDCWYTRLGVKLGFGQQYETAAVYYNGCDYGGVENSEIPNYVYRFSRREVVKTVQTNNPTGQHEFRFFYRTRVPRRLRVLKNPLARLCASCFSGIFDLAGRTFPAFANNIGFFVKKPPVLFPWIQRSENNEVELCRAYLEEHYQGKGHELFGLSEAKTELENDEKTNKGSVKK